MTTTSPPIEQKGMIMTNAKGTPRCLQTQDRASGTLICYRSKGHDLLYRDTDPDKAAHFDPDQDAYFGYPGKIRISIEVPGLEADIIIDEDVPDNYGAMSPDERLNHRGYAEERYRDLINVHADYVPAGEE